jgi:hypothetical protein
MRCSRFFLPLAIALFWCLNSQASVINAASCSQTDVQKAINAAQAGDTVVVPSGTCTYTTPAAVTPSLAINKAITVQGQTVCTGRASTLSCTDRTIIYDGTGTGSDEVPIQLSSSGARLTGFTFFDTRPAGDYKYAVQTRSGMTNWRIDHCHFAPANSTAHGIEAFGSGLIDHSYFDTVNTGIAAEGSTSSDATYNGDFNWSQPLNPGTGNAVYMEDNEFVYSQVLNGATDNYDGARFVFRYNDVKNTNVANHGLDSTTNGRSVLLMEIYNNTLSNSGTHIYQLMVSRGGSHFIFNNAVSATGGSFDLFLDLRNYRSDPFCASSGECGSWGTCDGTNSIDQNTSGAQGWPCKDQIGRGSNQGVYPGYSWGNDFKGSAPTVANINICGYTDCTRAQTYHILNNRDFYNEVAGFNGAAGVGSGPLSARPGACTSKVAYWATDTNTLYQCTGSNSWAAYYTPYTYPHPLQSGTTAGSTPPKPPSGLTSVVIK